MKKRITKQVSDPAASGFDQGEPVLGVKNTVLITSHIYPKTREAYMQVLEALQDNGYTIPDHAKTEAGEPEKDDLFFTLGDITAAECGSCDSTISNRGVKAHNHACECCGEPTCIEYRNGGALRLRFMSEDGYIGNDISFKIFGYNELEEGDWNELVVYADPLLKEYTDPLTERSLRPGLLGVDSDAEAKNVLDEAAEKNLYKRSVATDPNTGEEVPVIILPHHKSRMLVKGSTYDTCDLIGRIENHTMIKLFNGEKYDYWDKLPIPESLHLSRRYMDGFKHSMDEDNIHERIMGAAAQVSRADYYHQDGRAAFSDVAFQRMDIFVQHFVDVPYQDWCDFLESLGEKAMRKNTSRMTSRGGDLFFAFEMLSGAGKASYQNISGPDFIYSLAEWAGKMSGGKNKRVKDSPNIGNALEGMFKTMSGQKLSLEEATAMTDGMEEPAMKRFEKSLEEGLQEKLKARTREQVDKIVKSGAPKPDEPNEP